MSIPDSIRISLITAAAAGAGNSADPDWVDRVSDGAVSLFTLADPNSPLGKRLEKIAGSKRYVGTITAVGKKVGNNGQEIDKGLVTLQGKPSTFHADGIEQIQTDFLNSAEGAAVYAKAQALVGHRVLVYTHTESFVTAQGQPAKSKTLIHLDDLGEDKPVARQAQPARQAAQQQQYATYGAADDDSDCPV